MPDQYTLRLEASGEVTPAQPLAGTSEPQPANDEPEEAEQ